MLTLNDGRIELYQWDTGRKLSVAVECTQVHYSNKVFGRSIDVDVVDGVAIIPDILLQTDKELTAWAFVGTPENGYTKISKTFKVNRRNKPADYVFTHPEQTTLGELVERLQKIEETQDPDAIKNAVEDYLKENPVEAPVKSVNGKTGKIELSAEDVGAISQDKLQEATNEALAQAKASGEFKGAPGEDYVLTDEDVQEIAGIAAGMVEGPADLFGGYDRFYRSIARGRVNPEEPLDVATYDGSGQLTHPCVRHFPDGVAGHSWWMTASPYPNSALELENPCVWYSDDGIHWSADGVPNPLDLPLTVNGAQASMNSDPHLLVRPDGVMEVWWRTNYWENSGEGLYTVVYRRTSTDGVNWTAKEELHRMLTNSADGIVCPVALYEDGVYKIWAVSDQECLRYYESATGADWRHIRDIDVSNPDYPEYKVWHFDVNHTAKGYEFVGCYNIPGDYTSHKYLYYAVSQDNITYSKRVMILTRGETGRFDERLVYRPTIVRMADRVRIYYGANNADNVWSIGLMEAPSAYLFNAVLISGARVGAIESGQEWLDGRVTALESQGGGGDDRPADEGVTVVRSFDESPWLPGYWDPSNDGELTLYSNMHRTQLVELASLTVDGELPEITAKSSMAAWALVRFNYFDGNLRWIGADMGAFIDPGAGTQEPTRLTWPAGAVYVAISANTADKGAVTVSGVPEGGGCEISDEQIQKIAQIAAGMVEVPGGGSVAEWRRIGLFTAADNINHWVIDADESGNGFSCTEFRILAKLCFFQLAANSSANRGIALYGADGKWYEIALNFTSGGFANIVKGDEVSAVTASFKYPAVIDITTHGGLIVAETIGETANNAGGVITTPAARNRGLAHQADAFTSIRVALGWATNLVMAGSTLEIWGR